MKNSKLYNRISSHSFDFSKFLKLNMIIIGSIIALALIITAIFGLNTSYNTTNQYSFNVSIGTELTSKEYKALQDDIKNVLSENNFDGIKIVEEGSGYSNALTVTFKYNKNLTKTEFEDLNQLIEDKLELAINNEGQLPGFNVGELKISKSTISTSIIIMSVVSVIISIAVLSAYTFIRFDKTIMLSVLLGMIIDVLLVFSLVSIFRIKLGNTQAVYSIMTVLYSYILNIRMFGKIREDNLYEKNKGKTNAAVVSEINKSSFITKAVVAFLLSILGVAMLAFRNGAFIEFGAHLIAMSIVVLFTSIFVTPYIWATTYNKENDKRLVQRIEKRDKVVKEEDTIVV